MVGVGSRLLLKLLSPALDLIFSGFIISEIITKARNSDTPKGREVAKAQIQILNGHSP